MLVIGSKIERTHALLFELDACRSTIVSLFSTIPSMIERERPKSLSHILSHKGIRAINPSEK